MEQITRLAISNKLLFSSHLSLIENKTQTAVINMVNKRILIIRDEKNTNLVQVHQFKCTSAELYSLSLLFDEAKAILLRPNWRPIFAIFPTGPE